MSAANKSQHEQPTQTETKSTHEHTDASVHNAETANGEQPQAQAAQTTETPAGADENDTTMDDETQALMDDLQKAHQELAAFKDQYLRARAEVENIRRRADEEVAKARKFAVEGFAESLIPVRDSLEAALNQEDQTVEVLFEGVQTTLKQLDSAFERHQLCEVAPAVGDAFDPHLHQAISNVPSEQKKGTIAQVLQKGYTLSDRVLRPAMVMVSAG
ncbi:MAG TPA: nucleotide exchange factor GrpE [Paenalcaligenes sp.]|nr:nucleotide exchange factor GrpE [Paenalcaligenes sp.]